MLDNLQNRGPQNRSRITMQETHEVRYGTEARGVTMEELQRLVHKVGHSAAAVHRELGK